MLNTVPEATDNYDHTQQYWDRDRNKVYTPPNTSKNNTHYDAGGIETIAVIKAKLTTEQYKGYLLGNVIKYATRVNHKGSPAQDVSKLAEYGNWLRETYHDTSTK